MPSKSVQRDAPIVSPPRHITNAGIERPRCVDRLPSHISKMVVSTLRGGGPTRTEFELVSQSSLAGFSLLRIDRLRRAISWFARNYVKDMRNANGLRKIKIDDLECTRFLRQAQLRTFRWEVSL